MLRNTTALTHPALKISFKPLIYLHQFPQQMQVRDHITVAVFPFEDLSLRTDLGVFCRSFSADLTTELSRFRQFQVISLPLASSVAAPAAAHLFESIATDYFIQGTFRGEKELVRINVQLYDSNSRHMVWGNRLEGSLTSLAEIQDSLLTAIVGILQHQINQDLLSRLRKRPKVEFRAYEHWLYGMEEVKKGSVESDIVAREHFQQALEVQPDYSLAYTGMSLSYFNEWSCQLWDRWDVSKTGAHQWAEKAMESDDQNYIAAMVLGKVFLYDGAFDSAEYYFRKSLLLNSNDPETLIQLAISFIFLGLPDEGIQLYKKAMELNPLSAHRYFPYGALIYFEMGDFEKAASLIKADQKVKIANADAYYAAVYFYLQQYDNMHMHWQQQLDNYQRLISKGRSFSVQEVVDWIEFINPYRDKTKLDGFLKYITNKEGEPQPRQRNKTPKQEMADHYFVKDSLGWKLSYDGSAVQVPELKGFYDIQKLLLQPRQLFHCAELMGSHISDGGEKILDEKARREYQHRILELQADLHDAEQRSDFVTAEKLQKEYDQLVDYLSRSLGLKGRSRQAGGNLEKARSAVTWRIRNSIARIEQHHPLLGAHLSNAIKTGLLCSYQPDRDIHWMTTL